MTLPNDRIIEAIQKRHPQKRQLQISRSMPKFFDGELVVIEVTENNHLVGESYAYINSRNEIDATFLNIDELVGWVDSNEAPSRAKERWDWYAVNIVPGAIAIILTLMICVLLGVQQSRNNQFIIPDFLSNALTLILGFYFGQQVTRANKTTKENRES
jgi:hypothetical protein